MINTTDTYTWSQFVAAVTGMLTVDGRRAGIETFRSSMIRQGVIDLQNAIDGYRIGHETVYLPSDLVKEGRASRGVKPPQSVIHDAWLFKSCATTDPAPTTPVEAVVVSGAGTTDANGIYYGTLASKTFTKGDYTLGRLDYDPPDGVEWDLVYDGATLLYALVGTLAPHGTMTADQGVGTAVMTYHPTYFEHPGAASPGPRGVRYPTSAWPWSDRFALVNGKVAVNDGRGLFCIDPQGYTFYIYPEVFDCWMLSIHWNGLKLDFKDDEYVPFDESAAMAVAEFVKGKIAREVNHNLAEHDSYMKSFTMTKQKCFIAAKEQAGLSKGK